MPRSPSSPRRGRLPAFDRRDALLLAGAALFIVALFSKVLFSSAPLVLGTPEGDGRTQFYVWRIYGFGRLAQGDFPLWNPYTFAGMPFVGNLQSAMFYPTNWLFLAMSPWRAANWSVAANLFLSLAFAYGWGRMLRLRRTGALTLGAAYAFGAPQFLRVYEGHWCHLAAMPWIPWLMGCAEAIARRTGRTGRAGRTGILPVLRWPVALGAMGVALQAFAGHPQYLFYGGIAASAYFLVRLFTPLRRKFVVCPSGHTPPTNPQPAAYPSGHTTSTSPPLVVCPSGHTPSTSPQPAAYPSGHTPSTSPPLVVRPSGHTPSTSPQPAAYPSGHTPPTNPQLAACPPGHTTSAQTSRARLHWRGAAHRMAAFACVFVLGMAMSAVQMLPALELLSASARRGELSLEWVSQYSLAPESLLTLAVPRLYGIGPDVPYWGRWNAWEMGAHVGAVGFALAVAGAFAGRRRLKWPALGLAALLVLFALGGYTPLMRVLFRLPGFNLFRGLSRFMAPASLFVALLAGLGADALLAAGRRRKRAAVALCALAALLVLAAAATWRPGEQAPAFWRQFMRANFALSERPPAHHRYSTAAMDFALPAYRLAWGSLATSAGFAALLAALALPRLRLPKRAVAAALPLLLAADFAVQSAPYLATFDGSAFNWPAPVAEFLQSQGQPFRVTQGDMFSGGPLDPMLYGVGAIEGIEPNIPARYRDLFWHALERPVATQTTTLHVGRGSERLNLLRLMNWRFVVDRADRPMMDIPGTRAVFEAEGVRVDELPGWLPRARLVHRVVRADATSAESHLETLLAVPTDHVAVLAPDADVPPVEMPRHPPQTPRFLRYGPERVAIEVEAAAPGLLVVSDLHYPGWKASVNGEPVPVLRADYLCRAVHVPPGTHTVEFSYRPGSFWAGAWVSLAAWAGAGWWVSRRKRMAPQGGSR